MSRQLLLYLLKQHESSPETKFYESGLAAISPSEFQSLKKKKHLLFDQYDFEKESYFDKRGEERFVRRVNGKWLATSTENPEASVLHLKEQDLNRYTFDIRQLCEAIKDQNYLTKSIDEISQRLIFIGETEIFQKNVAVLLAFVSDDGQAEAELSGLRSKTDKMDSALVLCPTYEIKSQRLLSRLRGQGISCLTFKEAFKGNDYQINFGKILSGQFTVESGTKLTARQAQDYKNHEYLTADSLHLPGLQPRQRSNQIDVNGHRISIGDSLFVLLLKLVVAAKKNGRKGGWDTPGFAPGKHQPPSNLRTTIQGSLVAKDGQKFIESDGSKRYRISTHPNFITYDRSRLLRHPLSSAKALAKKLPR